MELISIALAPVLICIFYIYIRDKYEKEPIKLLLTGLIFGIIITFPIIQTETYVTMLMPICGLNFEAFYMSFAVASFVEESFKLIVLYFLVWKNRNFNESIDGIVYSVFISLGFAGFENVLYVFNPDLGGITTGLYRAIFSVPGHAFFGVTMGYFLSMAKYEPMRKLNLCKAFFVTWLLHGLYDYILLSGMSFMWIFIPFIVYLWYSGFKKINIHLEKSPFKTKNF